ncbi:MAG: hypothetical protein AAGA91_01730 [Pseudomonadota bacterium]
MTDYPTVAGPDPAADATLAALLEQLQERHRHSVRTILVYGSCLRGGDIYDGLLDLYVLVDSYRQAYPSRLTAVANWLLPPNVFYAEQRGDTRTLRAKVTVISQTDFHRGCSKAWFESYLWGRFAQPTYVIFARDAQAQADAQVALLVAAQTLLRRALPCLPATGSLTELWEQSLDLSYGTELRTERGGRAGELARASAAFYQQITRHMGDLGLGLTVDNQGCYHTNIAAPKRRLAALAWACRRVQGKLLSIARLVKGLFTFEGGLDYIAWKLERHSGESIVIPDKVRRRPLIHLWGFFWSLYRRGIFK